jgi:hypothetical protein
LQAFFQGAAAGGKVAEPLSEGGVLGGKPLDGVGVVLALGVAEMAKQLPDAGALGADLGATGELKGYFLHAASPARPGPAHRRDQHHPAQPARRPAAHHLPAGQAAQSI